MAVEVLPPFSVAYGVPRGGLPFALSLARYGTGNRSHPVLIAEDVATTGGSMEQFRSRLIDVLGPVRFVGVCAFARGPVVPSWVTPLFQMPARN
jgi:orotate phosphoribosyltransferase